MSEPIIRIRNAHKYYNKGKSNEIHVMNNVSLELPESGMVAVFGRSGCGKTTLLTAIGGLDSIAEGSIELFGRDIRKHTDTLRNKYVGYIFQNYNLNPGQTVFENVSAALRLCGMTDATEIHTRTMAALSNVDMEKYRDRTPDTLSGGQQQRVAIARAIVKSPAIILADEPTGNLDEENTVLVMDILKELSRTRLVLLVTHEADLVDHYCDRVIEIVDGKIHSDRTNKDARGYVQKSKNDIYLGELTRTETKTPGVTLEYYGEIGEAITLRLVNRDGRLYLKSSDPTVQLLDDRSEVQLVEGVFEAEPTAESTPRRSLELSALIPFEGKHFGRLYSFKNAFASAWRDNFSGKKKAGRILLSICLILLSMTLVTLTAVVGTGLDSYIQLRQDHDPTLFYVPLDPEEDYTHLMAGLGSAGMEDLSMVTAPGDHASLEFRSATFITAKASYLSAEGYVRDVKNAEGLPLAAGTKTLAGAGDILITTAVADKMLEDSPVEYLDSYEDLVGMVSRDSQYSFGNIHLRIVGVVESDQLFLYAGAMQAARYVLKNTNHMPLTPASATPYGKELKPGELLCIQDEYNEVPYKAGDTLTILGKTFTVSQVVKEYLNIQDLPAYVYETYGKTLSPHAADYAEKEGLSEEVALYAYYLEHLYPYVPEFCERIVTASQRQGMYVEFDLWAVAESGSIYTYASLMGQDPEAMCAAYLYREDHGSYPTEAELEAYLEDHGVLERLEPMKDIRALEAAYEESQKNYYGSDFYYYIISDDDYIALASSVGQTTMDDIQPYAKWEGFGFGGDVMYSHHAMILSSDPSATERFLTEKLGEDGFLTPAEVFREDLRSIELLAIIGFVGILVVLALMCLCMYFIMHAIFVSRIREVGILRAIGVTKKNILFRFGVETALISILTVAVGFGLSTWGVMSLIETPVFASLFFFPPWMAILLFGVLMVAAMIFGLLPALSLLRKTPAAILTKYDI